MRRKRIWDEWFKTIDEMVEYVKRIKGINGNKIECEITELFGGWHVTTWWIK